MSRSEEIDINIEDYVPEDLELDGRYRRSFDAGSLDPFKTSSRPRTPAVAPADVRPQMVVTPRAAAPAESPVVDIPSAHEAEAPQPQEAPRQAAADAQRRTRRERRAQAEARDVTPRMPGILRFLTDTRTKWFLGIALMILSVFVLISVISHFRTGARDQSMVLNSTLSQMTQEPASVKNSFGPAGAVLSHILLTDALGVGSIVLIPYLWMLALSLLGLRRCGFWSTTFKALLVGVTVSMVLGLVTFDAATEMYWGGIHGHYMNKLLIDAGTWMLAMLVSVLLVAAVCAVYLNEIKYAWDKWKAINEARRLREQLRRERERELQALGEEEEAADSPAEATPVTPAMSTESRVSETPQELPDDNIPVVRPVANVPFTVRTAAETPVAEDTAKDDDILVIDNPPMAPADSAADTLVEGGEGFSIVANEIETASVINNPGESALYDHRADLSQYRFPDIELLEDRPSGPNVDLAEQQANKDRIVDTLLKYKIPISRIEATVGPTVTLYEIVPAEGVRISQIKRLEDDIALSLSALGIRIIAPIPGKGTVGIEVPNSDPKTVSMRSVITSKKYQECKMALPMAMGATISNEIFIADMAKMPHLLVAGATGMGKSVGLNVIIASLLYKKHPSELKFVLIDPKMVEFSLYSKLERHYLAKLPMEDNAIITDMDKVLQTLNSLCVEMDQRYELLRDAGVRALEEYNKKFSERRLNPEKGHRYLPYIVVVVDEFADILMTKGKEVETPIARIAQKARAVGIHMILATQRPSTNVITGLIKANFPGRIAFRVIQMVDSRTILDCPGANQLIGRGDMLFSHNGNMQRVQCAFISTEEVEALTEHIDTQVGYEHAYYLPDVPTGEEGGPIAGASTDRDTLFDEAARFVVSKQMGSTSSLQRQFGVGYNRAGKLMDQMEAAGIVGPVNGSKPRAILVDSYGLEIILGNN